MKNPRFEIVKTRAKKLYTPASMKGRIEWHARLKGKNGEIVWTQEPTGEGEER